MTFWLWILHLILIGMVQCLPDNLFSSSIPPGILVFHTALQDTVDSSLLRPRAAATKRRVYSSSREAKDAYNQRRRDARAIERRRRQSKGANNRQKPGAQVIASEGRDTARRTSNRSRSPDGGQGRTKHIDYTSGSEFSDGYKSGPESKKAKMSRMPSFGELGGKQPPQGHETSAGAGPYSTTGKTIGTAAGQVRPASPAPQDSQVFPRPQTPEREKSPGVLIDNPYAVHASAEYLMLPRPGRTG